MRKNFAEIEKINRQLNDRQYTGNSVKRVTGNHLLLIAYKTTGTMQQGYV
jgi:hypothetical protein